jgi:hypothetical protein
MTTQSGGKVIGTRRVPLVALEQLSESRHTENNLKKSCRLAERLAALS